MPSVKPHIVLGSPGMRTFPGYRWFCYSAGQKLGGFGNTPAEAYAEWRRNNG